MKKLKIMELDEAQQWVKVKIMDELARNRLHQKDLAELMGISQPRLSKALRHPEKTSCATIWLVCRVFGYEPMPIIVRHGLGR